MKDYIYLIDKKKGISSFKAISELKFENKDIINKIGHAGTLDPMASGLLIALINKGTKLSDDIMHKNKVYEVEMILGYETDTLDLEGKIVNIKYLDIDDKTIIEAINSFKGEIYQIPPKYSALKINGKKLYEYAINNQEVEIKKRKVYIYDIYDIEIKEKNIIEESRINDICYPINIDLVYKVIKFKCLVSSGTYIRSLVRDIGYKLETFSTMSSLKRTKIGDYDITQINRPIGLNSLYKDFKEIISDENINKLTNGIKLELENNHNLKENDIIQIYNMQNKFIGFVIITKIKDNKIIVKKYKYFQ